ncbi:MAG TPA: SGNH/GDSL hydrolase family protein [Polyangiaceae bacterium]|nr:SGNH/GDSL hydrolase family protein [Polyangiaceae bacterium]
MRAVDEARASSVEIDHDAAMTSHWTPRWARLAAGAFAAWVAFSAGAAPPPAALADEPHADPKPPAKAKRTYVVAAMGDSLSDPKSHGGKYLEYLAARCPKSRFDSYGIGGNMVNMMRRRFARDVLGEGGDGSKPKYTHVIVLGGIGDILSNETAHRSAKKIEEDLAAMYAMAKAKGMTVVALTLPPWGGFKAYDGARHRMTLDVNAWLVARPADVDAVVDIHPLLSCGDTNKLCRDYAWPDQLHWAAKGHEVVGGELYAKVFADCE